LKREDSVVNKRTINPLIVKPLDKSLEKSLFEYMNQDRIRHFWGIYDLQHMKEKVRTRVALSGESLSGYLMEINERIIHIRGIADCATPLLESTDLNEPLFNIEPAHLCGVKRLYKNFKLTDSTSKGKITTYLSMKVNLQEFKPVETKSVRAISKEESEAVGNLLARKPDRIQDLMKGLSYGLYAKGQLVAFAAAPEILEDLAIIRGVYTQPSLRGKGYATNVCSAVTARLIEQGKEAFLYVSKDNHPALRVYRKLGFRETGHVFLSFCAERK
jgi:ribosomal protein S18 acetylase RimI-like enzyme